MTTFSIANARASSTPEQQLDVETLHRIVGTLRSTILVNHEHYLKLKGQKLQLDSNCKSERLASNTKTRKQTILTDATLIFQL